MEKYEKLGVSNFNGETCVDLSEKCAQIAVEYSDELVKSKDHELSVERYKTSVMNEAYEKAKQQRDELFEALKTVRICSNYKEVKAKHGNCDNWVNIIDELINKIDGK